MSDVHTIWQEMVTAAFLGTERRLWKLPMSTQGALPVLLGRLDASQPSQSLLEGAAVTGIYRQAGDIPVKLPPGDLAVSDTEILLRGAPAAASRLALMLSGQYRDFIPEWLRLAVFAQKRVPEELLPEVLDWGERHIDLVEHLLPALGVRGRWLARLMPGIEKVNAVILAESAQPDAVEDLWQTEKRQVRELLLRRLRQSDPALGRRLVQSTWREEGAEARLAFLETFFTGLSMEDEDFLESVLDDRAVSVRAAAADLLARLPESRLVHRQMDRAQAFVKWKAGGFLRKPQIEITLPEECDQGMQRDGVEPRRAAILGLGQKSEWLLQILGMVPPSTWSRQFGKSPAELLAISAGGEWETLLQEGWSIAARNFCDADWAEAFLSLNPKRAVLLEVLPEKRRQPFLVSHIRSRPMEGMQLLFEYHRPWGTELTRLCLQNLRSYYQKNNDPAWQYATLSTIRSIGRYMDSTLASEASSRLLNQDDAGSSWEKAVKVLLQILDFRHQMMEELK